MPVGSWDDCFGTGVGPRRPGLPGGAGTDRRRRAVAGGPARRDLGATITTGTGGPAVVKAGPVGTTDCRDGTGYVLAAALTFDDPLPLTEGVVVLCGGAGRAWRGRCRPAGTAVMVVDGTPPDQPITSQAGDDGLRARAELRPAGARLVRRQARRRHRPRGPSRVYDSYSPHLRWSCCC